MPPAASFSSLILVVAEHWVRDMLRCYSFAQMIARSLDQHSLSWFNIPSWFSA